MRFSRKEALSLVIYIHKTFQISLNGIKRHPSVFVAMLRNDHSWVSSVAKELTRGWPGPRLRKREVMSHVIVRSPFGS